MAQHAVAIFLSAFLLFQVQPIVSKHILPWFGGTPTVWSTTLLFFQVLLTGGYAWAHYLSGKPSRTVYRLHLGTLAAAVGLVALGAVWWGHPLLPGAAFKPTRLDTPALDIFIVLLVGVGAPFFLLATNSTLQQAWFSRRFPGASPYRLYALSNVGSLLGLLTYPVLIEPFLRQSNQAWVWATGFVLWSVTAVVTARAQLGHEPEAPRPQQGVKGPSHGLLWVGLAACASAMLLATTSQLTQEVAPIPFLWVLPLAVYLVSFILTFESDRWYRRAGFTVALAVMSALVLWMTKRADAGGFNNYLFSIGAHLGLLFVVSMVCHGELVRLKPEAGRLSSFYLLISIGGAVGGLFVNLVAPVIFDGYWEFPLCLIVAWLLLAASVRARPDEGADEKATRRRVVVLAVMGVVFGGLLLGVVQQLSRTSLLASRNFYGTLRVEKLTSNGEPIYALTHGTTVHGWQYVDEAKAGLPTSYFTENAGVGLLMQHHPKRPAALRVGVLGLGAGVLAAYCRPGDTFVFYEINPDDIRYAQGEGGYLRFLQRCEGTEVVAGDARLVLERELAANGSRQFDVLMMDAFSSDSVPAHLLTVEAVDLYLKHLVPGGVLAVNISNRYLDLRPVLWGLAEKHGLAETFVFNTASMDREFTSQWMLLSKDPQSLQVPQLQARRRAKPADITLAPWTDDFSNLYQVFRLNP